MYGEPDWCISRLRYFNPVGAHPSGTGVRDSLPVMNLGTVKGLSVLEVVQAFEDSAGIAIPYELTGRRDGWAWQSGNPNGYIAGHFSHSS